MVGNLRRRRSPALELSIRLRALLATGAALVCLCGCGSHASSSTSGLRTSVPPMPAATARTANCMLWNVLQARDRQSLVAGLRGFFTQRLDTGARERVLPDARETAIITRYCRLPFARAFLIYRIYGNATAFGGQPVG
jgi:hypothetical protein